MNEKILSQSMNLDIFNNSNQKNIFFHISKVDKKIFKCPFLNCKRQFREKGNLRTHIRVHTGERPFVCSFENCEKSFITLGNLKSHMSNHTGEKPFVCSIHGCGKQYSRLCRLKIHERTHCGDKPFKCPFKNCNKSFNEKGNLKTHFRIHTGEKPYICNFEGCTQSFKALGHLKDHLKRHYNIRPYICNQCSASFARTSTLKIHMHTHTGEKPHKCFFPGCEKSFSEKGNMKTHYRTHFSNGEVKSNNYLSVEMNNHTLEKKEPGSLLRIKRYQNMKGKKNLKKLSKKNNGNPSYIFPLKQQNVFIKISNENLNSLLKYYPKNCNLDKNMFIESLLTQMLLSKGNNILLSKSIVNNNYNMIIHQNTRASEIQNLSINMNSLITFAEKDTVDFENEYKINSSSHSTTNSSSPFVIKSFILNQKERITSNKPRNESLITDLNDGFNIDNYFNFNNENNNDNVSGTKVQENDIFSFKTNLLLSDVNNESESKNEDLSITDFFNSSNVY